MCVCVCVRVSASEGVHVYLCMFESVCVCEGKREGRCARVFVHV